MTEQTKRRGRPPQVKEQLEQTEANFQSFEKNIKEMTHDRLNQAPHAEFEPQTKLSQREINKSAEIYLAPIRSIHAMNPKTGQGEKFNEKFRKEYEYRKQYVRFIVENHEIVGEKVEPWTKPYAGVPAEQWAVPVNKPIWGPRYLAEQLSKCHYHRIVMQEDKIVSGDGMATYTGSIEVHETRPRISARPAKEETPVYMGASSFE